MDDRSLLEAIRQIVREEAQQIIRQEMAANNETLRQEMAANNKTLRQEMAANNKTLRQEMAANNKTLRQEMAANNEALKQEMAANNEALKQEIMLGVKDIVDSNTDEIMLGVHQEIAANNVSLKRDMMLAFNTVIEDKVTREYRLLAEQYGDIIAKLQKVDEQDEIKGRVRTLERVVADHTTEITNLKKAL